MSVIVRLSYSQVNLPVWLHLDLLTFTQAEAEAIASRMLQRMEGSSHFAALGEDPSALREQLGAQQVFLWPLPQERWTERSRSWVYAERPLYQTGLSENHFRATLPFALTLLSEADARLDVDQASAKLGASFDFYYRPQDGPRWLRRASLTPRPETPLGLPEALLLSIHKGQLRARQGSEVELTTFAGETLRGRLGFVTSPYGQIQLLHNWGPESRVEVGFQLGKRHVALRDIEYCWA